MKNNRFTHLKATSTIKNSLMESAMGWKQLNGCYPTVSEFSQKINEFFNIEVFGDDITGNTEEVNESYLSAFSSILGILLEGVDHDVLGVPEGASIDEIRKAFHTKIKSAHPDLGGSDAEAQKIKDAYDRLIGRKPPTSSFETGAPTDPRAREAWERASREERTRAWASDAARRRAATGSSTPSGDSGAVRGGSLLKRAAKAVPAIALLSYLASEGQRIAGQQANAMGAGPSVQTGAEIGGAYLGDVLATSGLNFVSRLRGKTPSHKPSLGAAAGFVLGGKVSDDPLTSATMSLVGGLGGHVAERKLLPKIAKFGKFGKAIPGLATLATLGSLAASDSAEAATPAEIEAESQARGRALAGLSIPGMGLPMVGLELAGLESPAAKQAREEKEQRELFKVPSVSADEAKKGIHRYMSQWDKKITDIYRQPAMNENTNDYPNMIELNENVGRFVAQVAKEAPDILRGLAKYAEPEIDTLRKIFFSDLEKKIAEVAPEIKIPTTELKPATAPIEIKAPEVKRTTPVEIKPVIPVPAKETAYEIKPKEIDTLESKTADLAASKADTAIDAITGLKTQLAPQTNLDLQTKTETALETQTKTKTEQETALKIALNLLTKTQTAPKLQTRTQTQTQTQLTIPTKMHANLQLAGAPKPITGVTPSVSTRTPIGYGGLKGARGPVPEEPEKTKASRQPAQEMPVVSPMGDVRYPALRAASYGILPIYEGIYNPKVSLQKKSEKQKYKIVVVQEGGKKVEIFATSLRGVKRAIYGKKNFRVYDAKGTEISSYFKRIQKKTQNKMRGK